MYNIPTSVNDNYKPKRKSHPIFFLLIANMLSSYTPHPHKQNGQSPQRMLFISFRGALSVPL